MHHVIICQIDSVLKHQCCVWEEKHFKYRQVTVQGPRQEITYCPETQVPTNKLSSELEQDTTQNGILCYLELCPTPTHISIWHKQYTGTAVATKVHPDVQKMLIFKVRTSSSPQRSFTQNKTASFVSLSPVLRQTLLPLYGLSSGCRWWGRVLGTEGCCEYTEHAPRRAERGRSCSLSEEQEAKNISP